MVQLKQLFDDPNVEFVAGRKFLWDGVTYQVGDDIPNAKLRDARNRESILRSGRAIPVTADLNDVPRAYRKEIKDRHLTFRKLKRTDDKPYKPTGKTIPIAEKGLNERLSTKVWAYALLDEQKHGNRAGLVTFIKAGHPTEVSSANLQSYVENAANYANGQYLHDFVVADGQAAY